MAEPCAYDEQNIAISAAAASPSPSIVGGTVEPVAGSSHAARADQVGGDSAHAGAAAGETSAAGEGSGVSDVVGVAVAVVWMGAMPR